MIVIKCSRFSCLHGLEIMSRFSIIVLCSKKNKGSRQNFFAIITRFFLAFDESQELLVFDVFRRKLYFQRHKESVQSLVRLVVSSCGVSIHFVRHHSDDVVDALGRHRTFASSEKARVFLLNTIRTRKVDETNLTGSS